MAAHSRSLAARTETMSASDPLQPFTLRGSSRSRNQAKWRRAASAQTSKLAFIGCSLVAPDPTRLSVMGSGTVRAPCIWCPLERHPPLPQETRSTTRLGTREGDWRSDCDGAEAPDRVGSHRRHHHLRLDPLRGWQTSRRVGVPHVGLGPTSSAGSKNETAGVVRGLLFHWFAASVAEGP